MSRVIQLLETDIGGAFFHRTLVLGVGQDVLLCCERYVRTATIQLEYYTGDACSGPGLRSNIECTRRINSRRVHAAANNCGVIWTRRIVGGYGRESVQ